MALSLVRLEAEAADLNTVVKDIEAAAKALKIPAGLIVHDEHYERLNTGNFKGRRVFKGPDRAPVLAAGTTISNPALYWGTTSSSSTTAA